MTQPGENMSGARAALNHLYETAPADPAFHAAVEMPDSHPVHHPMPESFQTQAPHDPRLIGLEPVPVQQPVPDMFGLAPVEKRISVDSRALTGSIEITAQPAIFDELASDTVVAYATQVAQGKLNTADRASRPALVETIQKIALGRESQPALPAGQAEQPALPPVHSPETPTEQIPQIQAGVIPGRNTRFGNSPDFHPLGQPPISGGAAEYARSDTTSIPVTVGERNGRLHIVTARTNTALGQLGLAPVRPHQPPQA